MKRRFIAQGAALFGAALALGAGLPVHAAIAPSTAAPEPTAEQIVARNADARGGLEAWRKVGAMAWAGRVESAAQPNMPFVLEQKRPDKTRFDLVVAQQKTSRMFDGSEGWKLRQSAKSPRPELQPYSAEEMAFARTAAVIDGPLMDFKARGYQIVLEGQEDVQGRRAYRLRSEMPSGQVQRVWVDAQNFLELRLDRLGHDGGGRPITVSVFYGNYKAFDGLVLPMSIETRAGDSKASDRLVIEQISINPALEDALFSRPKPKASRGRGVVVDTRSALQSGAGAAAPAQ